MGGLGPQEIYGIKKDKWQVLHLERKNLLHQYGLRTELFCDLRPLEPPLGRSACRGRDSLGERLGSWKGTDAQASSSWPKRLGCGKELSGMLCGGQEIVAECISSLTQILPCVSGDISSPGIRASALLPTHAPKGSSAMSITQDHGRCKETSPNSPLTEGCQDSSVPHV